MPMRPGRLCRYPQCGVIVHHPDTHCPAHKKLLGKQDRERRGTSAARGYDARHRRWRLFILRRDPICKGCGMAISVIADHVKPLSQGGDWSLENGRGMCKPCHDSRTARDNQNLRK